jgi:hypothetical protein
MEHSTAIAPSPGWPSVTNFLQHLSLLQRGKSVYATTATNKPIIKPPDDTSVSIEQWWNNIDNAKLNN